MYSYVGIGLYVNILTLNGYLEKQKQKTTSGGLG